MLCRASLLIIGALGLGACSEALPHPPYVQQRTDALTLVATPPPPGRAELVPKKPPGADTWVDGEWIPRAGRWSWLLGRWIKVPAGAKYAPWVVVRARDGSAYYARSSWRDAQGAAIPAPTALAFATVREEAVNDPQGEVDETGPAMREAPVHTVTSDSPDAAPDSAPDTTHDATHDGGHDGDAEH